MQEQRISIIGVGGAGCLIVDRLTEVCPNGPGLVAINTDARSLTETRVATKLQIGAKRTGGLGAGGDAEVGRAAAEDDVHMIRSLVAGADVAILVAGLGGGTGSGALPVIVDTAREEGTLAICLAVYPLDMEGRPRLANAEQALKTARSTAEAVLVVRAARLFDAAGGKGLSESFEKADRLLASALHGLWLLLSRPGFINLDLADLRKVTRERGTMATLGFGEGSGRNRVDAAVTALLTNPLLDQGQLLKRARSLLVSIVGGPDLTLKEAGDIMKAVAAEAPDETKTYMGTAVADDWRGRVLLTAVAAEPWDAVSLEEIEVPEAEVADEPDETVSAPKKGGGRPLQTKLRFETPGKGRFKNVEPTILHGEDLDIPTFIRQGIAIEK